MAILGRYIVADPAICRGKPTFKGTRILGAQLLDQVAENLAWKSIVETWGEAINEGRSTRWCVSPRTPSGAKTRRVKGKTYA
jgi:hypothetical protein